MEQPRTLDDVVTDGADLDAYADGLAEQLRAFPPDPFVDAADARFTTAPEIIHAWLLKAADAARSRGHETPMIYVELNGFDINYDQWHVDAFPLAELAVADGHLREGSYEELPVSVPHLPLTGMERMQEAFRWWDEEGRGPAEQDASRDLADELVHARLLQRFRDAVMVGDLWSPDAQVAVTAHDRDPVLRFAGGRPVVERDHRPSDDQLRPRPLQAQVDVAGCYSLMERGGEYVIHPVATATRETASTVRAIEAKLKGRRREVELPSEPPLLHLSQPVFEDVIEMWGGVMGKIVSDPLLEVLVGAADPEGAVVSHPVDVAHPTDGTVKRYHLMHVTTVLERVEVPTSDEGAQQGSGYRASDVRRHGVFLPNGFFSGALAMVSGAVLATILERGCGTGLIARRVNVAP